ncbi:MAG: SemiSWEET transporter [candidate division Zixibacteria bacterium]|jgi:MtN3 and saliva related transmembrane protein|nr:SemiSWEET transporter [candidate division Zixibacteria bacterium]
MDTMTIIGFLAGTLTTVSFLPQLVKAWRTRSTGDISLAMYVVFVLGVFLWLVYGIFLASLPVIAANAITLVIAIVILLLKIRYR